MGEEESLMRCESAQRSRAFGQTKRETKRASANRKMNSKAHSFLRRGRDQNLFHEKIFDNVAKIKKNSHPAQSINLNQRKSKSMNGTIYGFFFNFI